MSWEKASAEDWKAKIIADLKGKPFEQLIWQSPDGLSVEPFYTEASPVPVPGKKEALWKITESVIGNELSDETINRLALQSLQGGAQALFLEAKGDPNIALQQVLLEIAPVFLNGNHQESAWLDFFAANPKMQGNAGIDPLAAAHSGASKGYLSAQVINWVTAREKSSAQWGILSVNGSLYKNSGGSIMQEIAFTLAALQEHLHQLSLAGLALPKLGTLLIKTAVGTNFFFEIAKIRVLRVLITKVLKQYQLDDFALLAESDQIHTTQLDIQTNILRLSTSAMSAVLGGADYLVLHPYAGDADARRTTRNIQHLLLEESYMDKNADPVAGAYYIEHLTRDLMEKGWQLFLETEQNGGYLQCLVSGTITEAIRLHFEKQAGAIANRKEILLGVNQFPNLKETLTESVPGDINENALLPTRRLAEPFEQLRIRMQHHVTAGKPQPVAFLWQDGKAAMRSARAAFALNFLGCAGIPSVQNQQPGDHESTYREFRASGANILVLCSDNDSWEQLIPSVIGSLCDNKPIIILAGKASFASVDICIWDGCPVLEQLETLLQMLGVE